MSCLLAVSTLLRGRTRLEVGCTGPAGRLVPFFLVIAESGTEGDGMSSMGSFAGVTGRRHSHAFVNSEAFPPEQQLRVRLLVVPGVNGGPDRVRLRLRLLHRHPAVGTLLASEPTQDRSAEASNLGGSSMNAGRRWHTGFGRYCFRVILSHLPSALASTVYR